MALEDEPSMAATASTMKSLFIVASVLSLAADYRAKQED
jgi:hypothetical protein